MRKIIIVLSGIAILALGYLGNRLLASSKKDPEKKVENTISSAYVEVAKNKKVPLNITTSGSIVAKERMEIYAEVTGIFEQGSQPFKTGNYFSKGSTLIQINDDEFRASVISQRATFKNLITGILADIQFDYPESFDMWKGYLNSIDIERELPQLPETKSEKETHYVSSKNINTTFYNIKNLETKLSKYRIRAPFSGVLVETNVTVGTLVNQGQKLGEYIRPDVYELELNVNASYKELLEIGREVKLNNIDNTKSWIGKVVRINPQINTNNQTVQIFVEVVGKDLSEGEFIEADIEAQDIVDAIEISRELLVNNESVYIVRDNTLHLVPIEIIFDNTKTAIVKGIEDGMKLLSKPVPGAYEGMKVSIVQ